MRLIALLNHLYTMETIQHKMRILEQPGPSADEALARLVAGNMFSPEVTGSLQYAGSHLETPLFVVLGHDGCGGGRCRPDHQLRGRTALLADSDPGGRHPARAAGVRPGLSPQVRLARVVECNVLWTVRQILSTPEG